MGANELMNRLDAGVRAFEKNRDLASYCGILETFFDGIRENSMIEVLFNIDFEARDEAPATIEYEDGSESLLILTNMSEGTAAPAVPVTLRSLLKEFDRKENCDGFIINPGHDDLFIPKTVIKAGIGAGYQVAFDEIEDEAALMATNRSEKELVVKRPMAEEEYAELANRIRAFNQNIDDFLKISFLHDDDLLFIQVLRTEQPGERHLSFGFDMSDFGWDKPLMLGNSLTTDKTLEIIRKVCVDGIDPNNMKELEEFKPMG